MCDPRHQERRIRPSGGEWLYEVDSSVPWDSWPRKRGAWKLPKFQRTPSLNIEVPLVVIYQSFCWKAATM